MFFDLNIPHGDMRLESILNRMIEFEYFGVGLNQTIDAKALPKSVDSVKLPKPVERLNPTRTGHIYEQSRDYTRTPPNPLIQSKIRQFTRLTVVVDDAPGSLKLTANNAVLRAYDIVAVQPTSEKSFHAACKDAAVDIITFDMSTRMPFYFKHTSLNLAIQRGIYFEICYSPAIRDSNARRNLIANARSLLRSARGKNILISSQALSALELRSPCDVLNIATLFGLSIADARVATSTNASHVLHHAHARKNVYRSVISIEPSSQKRKADELIE